MKVFRHLRAGLVVQALLHQPSSARQLLESWGKFSAQPVHQAEGTAGLSIRNDANSSSSTTITTASTGASADKEMSTTSTNSINTTAATTTTTATRSLTTTPSSTSSARPASMSITSMSHTSSTTRSSSSSSTTLGGLDTDQSRSTYHPGSGSAPPPTDCIRGSTATYTYAVPTTVYVTIESSYTPDAKKQHTNFALTANASATSPPTIYETPAQACATVILTPTPLPSSTKCEDCTGSQTARSQLSSAQSVSFAETAAPTQQAFVTVFVTKKTPVSRTPTSTSAPVTFGGKPFSQSQSTSSPGPSDADSSQAIGVPGQTPSSPSSTQSDSGWNHLGSLIDSIINSPWSSPTTAPAAKTDKFVPFATTAQVNGVPVSVGPSQVVVGSSTLGLPLAGGGDNAGSGPLVISANGVAFTIYSNSIVAPSTTYAIPGTTIAIPSNDVTITQPTSTITTGGVAVTIGPSQAIISGTTYRIGTNAPGTLVTVSGKTFSLGPGGVAITSSLYSPPITIVNARYELVVVNGMTFSIGQSEAIISGSTFRIGAGAVSTTVTVSSTTFAVGPAGVVVGTVTLDPTSISMISATPGATGADTSRATATSSGSIGNGNGQPAGLQNDAAQSSWSGITASLTTAGLAVFVLASIL